MNSLEICNWINDVLGKIKESDLYLEHLKQITNQEAVKDEIEKIKNRIDKYYKDLKIEWEEKD